MVEIYREKCVACRRDSPSVSDDEIADLLSHVSTWEILLEDGIKRLDRVFSFSNFVKALEFTKAIGLLAETEGHHPRLTTEWGSVRVTWWTHKIRNLHRNDFIMASKTDHLYQRVDS